MELLLERYVLLLLSSVVRLSKRLCLRRKRMWTFRIVNFEANMIAFYIFEGIGKSVL